MKDVFVPCLSAVLRFLKPQGIINSTHKRPLCGHCAPALAVKGIGAEGTVSDAEAVART